MHGSRSSDGLYADSRLRELSARHSEFDYIGCVSGEPTNPLHHAGRVTDWLRSADLNLDGFQVFAAGHPDMVAEMRAICSQSGAKVDLVTDAFVYAHASPPGQNMHSPARRAPPPDPALWAELGEGEILRAVLQDFYARAFADERLGPFFVGVTEQRLREKQYSFLRSLILGTRDYFGQRPGNAHHWMVISDDLFDYRLGLMDDCMRRQGLAEAWIERWRVFEEFFRPDVVKAEARPRIVSGQEVVQDGMDTAVLDEGCLCDGCQRVLDPGCTVRYHRRLGTVLCPRCCENQAGASNIEPLESGS